MDIEGQVKHKQQETDMEHKGLQLWTMSTCSFALVGALASIAAAAIAANIPKTEFVADPTPGATVVKTLAADMAKVSASLAAEMHATQPMATSTKPWAQRAYSVTGELDAHYLDWESRAMPIGYHSARIAESGDALADVNYIKDGHDGKTDWGFGSLAPVFTVGEQDKNSGYTPVGVVDGIGAFRKDRTTMRMIYQAESYGNLADGRSWHQHVNQNGAKFTGSHVSYIDYTIPAAGNPTAYSILSQESLSYGFADVLQSNPGMVSAAPSVQGAGSIFDHVYNLAGDKVVARNGTTAVSKGAHFGDTSPAGHFVSADLTDKVAVAENAWTFHSFCSAHLEQAAQWPSSAATDVFGVVDDMWITVEEWTDLNATAVASHGFAGLSAHITELATKKMYAVGAFGLGGFEKIVEFSCGHADFTCFAISGYNGNFGGSDVKTAINARKTGTRGDGKAWAYPQDIVPARIYIGRKGAKADGTACTKTNTVVGTAGSKCTFLERNGLAYGQVYGFAVPTATKDRDSWHKGNMRDGTKEFIDNTAGAKFAKINWRFNASNIVSVEEQDIYHWQDAPVGQTGMKFWTSGGVDAAGCKTEHASPSPTGQQAFVHGSTCGYFGIYSVTDLVAKLTTAKSTGFSSLPTDLTATYEMMEGETVGLDSRIAFCKTTPTDSRYPCVAGQGARADGGDATYMYDGSNKRTFEDIDGLEWIVAAGSTSSVTVDGTAKTYDDYFVIQEDGGNHYGERLFIAKRPSSGVNATFHFAAQAGGKSSSRTSSGVSVPARTHTSASASEFSGVADVSGVLRQTTLGGRARRIAEMSVAIDDKSILIGLQHHSASSDVIKAFNADRGGQIYFWDVANVA